MVTTDARIAATTAAPESSVDVASRSASGSPVRPRLRAAFDAIKANALASRTEELRVTDRISRDALPIPDRPYEGELPLDAKDPDATFPPIHPLRPPDGAPNVLVILLDDVGFTASSAFGGPGWGPLKASGPEGSPAHSTAQLYR